MNKKYQIVNSRSNEDCTIFYVLYIVLIFVVVFIIYKIIYNFTYTEGFNNLPSSQKNNGTINLNTVQQNISSTLQDGMINTLQKDLSKTNLDQIANITSSLGLGDNLSSDMSKIKNLSPDQVENIVKTLGLGSNLQDDLAKIKKLSSEQILSSLIDKNNELTNIKNTIQDKLEKQSQAIYISQNYNKVDSSSFDDELLFLLTDFANTKLPEIDIDNKKLIDTKEELGSILSEASKMKNFYKPGDIVTANSTFEIDKNNICYRHDGKPIKPSQEFISKYPECMVCSIEHGHDVHDSNSWKYTRTNIDKVCLYNPTAEANSGIPNLQQCKQFCGLSLVPNNTPVPKLITSASKAK